MLIPAIDLMGGKIVQLIQGKTKVLEFDDTDYWIARFAQYPLVHVVDLDAAMDVGENRRLIRHLSAHLKCQVGGGVRSVGAAQELLAAGAEKVIIGSALIADGKMNLSIARDLAETVGTDRLVFALDSRNGKVVIQGWREPTDYSALDMIQSLEAYCGTFLYTHVDTEGLQAGVPKAVVRALREATSKALLVAGGVASLDEVLDLEKLGVDAVVGMALYTGRIDA